jgi:hypothetical protein
MYDDRQTKNIKFTKFIEKRINFLTHEIKQQFPRIEVFANKIKFNEPLDLEQIWSICYLLPHKKKYTKLGKTSIVTKFFSFSAR